MTAVELRPGSILWFEGQTWTVDEVSPDQVRLRSGDSFRAVSLHAVVTAGRMVDTATHADEAPDNVILAGLSPAQHREVQRKARIVCSLLEADEGSLQERLTVVARREEVSQRTLERWLHQYRSAGPAGLVNSRVLRQRSSAVDPRWDAACLEVLRESVSASTPTMNVVIDRIGRRLEEEHGAARLTPEVLAGLTWQAYTGGALSLSLHPHLKPAAPAPALPHEELRHLVRTAATHLHHLAGCPDSGTLQWQPP